MSIAILSLYAVVDDKICNNLRSLDLDVVAKRPESVRKQHGALFSLEGARAAARNYAFGRKRKFYLYFFQKTKNDAISCVIFLFSFLSFLRSDGVDNTVSHVYKMVRHTLKTEYCR